MIENSDRINLLLVKLENLLQRQESFSKEICDLRDDINKLKAADENRIVSEKLVVEPEKSIPEADSKVTRENPIEVNQSQGIQPERIPSPVTARPSTPEESIGNNLEKFIGENLINKIGIVITIIGVAIGAKYSIEHQLISPLTRIILGYLMGIGLLGIGIRLKEQYENFSAVLVSGAMAIVYFITFFAYSFYGLIPQGLAFLLMVLITSATVYAALNYNKQVIAHIGLVGAYTVPFLLSDGSGKVAILYSYMAIINIGILVIAFKKYWKLLYYASFVLTWLIFVSWFASKYQFSLHYELASTFLAVFFNDCQSLVKLR